jgi:hypothetical protein
MTDKELATFGERLYQAVLLTPLPAGTILGLATAVRHNLPWSELPKALRFSVFKIAAVCLAETAESTADEAASEPEPDAPTAGQAPTAADGRPGENEPPATPPTDEEEPRAESEAEGSQPAEPGASTP